MNSGEWFFRFFISDRLFHHAIHLNDWSEFPRPPLEALVAHYCATKAAVISYTQSAALALAPHKIRVNAISPGGIDTPVWKQVDGLFAKFENKEPIQKKREVGEAVPLGYTGAPSDVARVAVFLASEQSAYITLVQFSHSSIVALAKGFPEFGEVVEMLKLARSGIEFVAFNPTFARGHFESIRDNDGPERILAFIRFMVRLNEHAEKRPCLPPS